MLFMKAPSFGGEWHGMTSSQLRNRIENGLHHRSFPASLLPYHGGSVPSHGRTPGSTRRRETLFSSQQSFRKIHICWTLTISSHHHSSPFHSPSGWWFEPLWKILVNWDDIPNIWENKKCSKPPTSHMFDIVSHVFFPWWPPAVPQPWGSRRRASRPPRAAEGECHDLQGWGHGIKWDIWYI